MNVDPKLAREGMFMLADVLRMIITFDPSLTGGVPNAEQLYQERNMRVIGAVSLALAGGMEAGYGYDPAAPGYIVAYIELPEGQVSWHIKEHGLPYDEHTTLEKCLRIQRFMNAADTIRNVT